MTRPALAVVVIGRNEGERLERCLRAVRAFERTGAPAEVVYVDSGSSDGSPERAAAHGARVLRLACEPSAAAARNLGWRSVRAPFVFFLDGDTVPEPGFARRALARFRDPRAAAVWGRLRELRPEQSVFTRVQGMDWNAAEGETESCGGNAIFRRSALEEVGGYDESFKAGEEPELCRRLRMSRWSIVHVAEPMAGHDLAMTRFSQYWTRCVRTGYAFAKMEELTAGTPWPVFVREARHARRSAAAAAAAGLLALAAAAAGHPGALALIPLAAAAAALRTAWRHRARVSGLGALLEYSVHAHAQMFPNVWGQLLRALDRRRGKARGLIEYKAAAPAAQGAPARPASLGRTQVISLVAWAGYLASRIVLPPIVIASLGIHLYGVWAVMLASLGYLSVIALGVHGAIVRGTAAERAAGRPEEAGRLAAAGALCLLAAAAPVWTALMLWAGTWTGWVGISGADTVLAVRCLLVLAAAQLVFEQALGAFSNALDGCQRQAERSMLWMACAWLEAGLIVFLLGRGLGLWAMTLAFASRMAANGVGAWVLLVRLEPSSAPRFGVPARRHLREFAAFGGVVQLGGVLNTVLFSIEKVLAGFFTGPLGTALVEVAEKLPVIIAQAAGSLNGPLMPAAAHWHGAGRPERVRDIYLEGSRRTAALTGAAFAFAAVFAAPILAAWLGEHPELAGAPAVMAVFCVAWHFHVSTGAGSAVHRAVGTPARELLYPVSQSAAVAVLVPAAVAWMGRTPQAVAYGVSAAMALSACLYMAANNRWLGVPSAGFLRTAAVPAAAPYALALASHACVRAMAQPQGRGETLVWLGAAAALYGCLWAGAAWLLLGEAERAELRRRLPRPARLALGGV